MFSVYILFSEKLQRYYTGTTDDVSRRIAEHNSGLANDAFTYRGIPWKIFMIIENLGSEQAYRIEKHIKSMKSRKYIENLHAYPEMIEKLIYRFK